MRYLYIYIIVYFLFFFFFLLCSFCSIVVYIYRECLKRVFNYKI